MNYWVRIVAAWLLLRFASLVMKDAEKLLQQTSVRQAEAEIVDVEVVQHG